MTIEKVQEMITVNGWENEPDNIIEGNLWIYYLTTRDYSEYIKDGAKKEDRMDIKEQIIGILKKKNK